MKIQTFCIACLVMALTACSSNKSSSNDIYSSMSKEELAKNDIQCEKIAVLGSKIPKKVCRSKVQREYEQQSAQDAVRKMQSQGGRAGETQ